jgi:hypothetical protein
MSPNRRAQEHERAAARGAAEPNAPFDLWTALHFFDGTKTSACAYYFWKSDWSCGEGHMGQDQIPGQVFVFATVLLAAFFGSIAVALSWFG